MVDFNLSDEQRQIQNLACDFATNEIAPVAAHHDRSGEFPREVCRKAWDIGLMNVQISPEFGGLGLGCFEASLIAEEIAFGCTGIGTAMEANGLAIAPVELAGTEEQKKRFLAPMMEELQFAAYCVTEPSAGSDVSAIKSVARKVKDEYVINGEKMWITNGGVADWYYFLARTDEAAGHRGLSAFLIKSDSEGISVGKKENNMGQRASDTRSISFQDVRVPIENLLGREGDGFKISMQAFDHTRPLVSSAAVGLARSALDKATRYAMQRETFGQAIAMHQSINFILADMDKDIQAARLLCWHASWLKDQNLKNTREAAIAKAFAADVAMRAATDAVQVFGGYGYSNEYPVEKLMRDAKIFQIYEGTSQIQRLIIGRQLVSTS